MLAFRRAVLLVDEQRHAPDAFQPRTNPLVGQDPLLHGYAVGAVVAREEQEGYLIKALNSSTTDPQKEFYIHELKLIGSEDSIAVLSKYLNHPVLCSHASMALLSIHNAIENKDELKNTFLEYCKNNIQIVGLLCNLD